ncbi:hypothetical protein H5410_050335 [Solanum commersonii]|uniref:Uncharacterized protein n=1 Tax=Solanum commersonii TaxID=4109 RepID=A0A9J5WXA7_SOLCO|nr:hypothetical protein H5410_050335 [Solanum commersonii]
MTRRNYQEGNPLTATSEIPLKIQVVEIFWLALISRLEFIKTHLTTSGDRKDNTHHNLVLAQHRVRLKSVIDTEFEVAPVHLRDKKITRWIYTNFPRLVLGSFLEMLLGKINRWGFNNVHDLVNG